MTSIIIRAAIGALVPTLLLFTHPAVARVRTYDSCSQYRVDRQKQCNKEWHRQLARERRATTPFLPSKISPALAHLDSPDQNPLATDDWYLGVYQTGWAPMDQHLATVDRSRAMVRMTDYLLWLHKNGQQDQAVALATVIAAELPSRLEHLNKYLEESRFIKDQLKYIPSDLSLLARVTKAMKRNTGIRTALSTALDDAATALQQLEQQGR